MALCSWRLLHVLYWLLSCEEQVIKYAWMEASVFGVLAAAVMILVSVYGRGKVVP